MKANLATRLTALANLPGQDNIRELDDSESEDESSEYEMSDIDSDNCRQQRSGLVLDRTELQFSPKNKSDNDIDELVFEEDQDDSI